MCFFSKTSCYFVLVSLCAVWLSHLGESQKVCTKTHNDYCFLSNDKECSQLLVQPSSCLLDSSKCQYVFDWRFNDDLIEFTLNKFNFKLNQWNGILFSFDSSKKSDLVIALMPENGRFKLINGAITNGSDITILNDENKQDKLSASNNILNKSIKLNEANKYIEIKFSRYELSTCGNVLVYLLNGTLSKDGSILYDRTSLPEPLGSFCFSSSECNSFNAINNYTAIKSDLINSLTYEQQNSNDAESDYQIVELQIKAKALNLRSNFNSTLPTTTTTTTISLTTTTTSTRLESDEPSRTTLTETTIAPITTNRPNATEGRIVETTATTNTSSNTTSVMNTTNSTSVSHSAITNSSYIFNTTVILSTTTEFIPTNPLETSGCFSYFSEIGVNGNKFKYNYNGDTDRVEFTFLLAKANNNLKFAVFINYDNNSNPIFLVYVEKNKVNDANYLINSNNSITGLNAFFEAPDSGDVLLQLSMPSKYKFNNSQIEMRNVYYFRIYVNYNALNRTDFFNKINTTTYTDTSPVCIGSCILIPKNNVKFYAQMRIDNIDWSDDYYNLTSSKSTLLATNISQILNSTFSSDIHKYKISNLTLLDMKPLEKRRKRDLEEESVLLTLAFSVQTPVSIETTKMNVDRVLQGLTASSSSSLLISGVVLSSTNPLNEVASTTTPFYASQSDYPAQLALALSLSLIATIIVLGGGLAGFLYWRKSKFRGPAARSAHTNPFLRVFGDRFSSNRYRAPPAVRLDGLPPTNYANDEFELNHYENHTFDAGDGAKNEQNFTDFTGSREVGIDIGDLADASNPFTTTRTFTSTRTSAVNETNENESKLKVPSGIITTPIGTANHRLSRHNVLDKNLEQVKEEEEAIKLDDQPDKTQLKLTNPFYNNENEPNDSDANEMTRDDFDKFLDTRFSELLDDKNIQDLLTSNNNKKIATNELDASKDQDSLSESSNNESLNRSDDEEEEEEDAESELNNIFNKDTIEKNLPELFGEYVVNNEKKTEEILPEQTANVNLEQERAKSELRVGNNASRVSAPLGFASKSNFDQESDSLSTSSVVSDELNDKDHQWPHEENAFSNQKNNQMSTNDVDGISLKSEDLDDYKQIDSSAFKNMRVQANNFVLNDPNQKSTLKDLILNQNLDVERKSNNFTNDFLITELPKPRICLVKVNKSFDGLGIHLCGTKNHMIKNIEPNSPADMGGLKPGDKILVINNENVEEASYTTVVNRLKDALLNQTDINLVVMNIIEYNMFKEKNPALENLKIKTDNKDIESKRSSLDKSLSNESENELAKEEDEEEEEEKKKSIFDFDETKFQMENFVNAEFNPFHDVPNEMFSPFLHYASIPPPASFQVNEPADTEDYFNVNTTPDPFQLTNVSPNLKLNNQINDDSNSDLSDNSINSLRNAGFKFTDFDSINRNNTSSSSNMGQLNEFEDNFLKTFKPPEESAKVYKKATPVKPSDFAMWNSSTSDYSDNGNDLIDHEIISQVSTPKIRDRF